MTRLFIYGSLKRGFIHHVRLRSATFIAEARTSAGFCLVTQGRYPALVAIGEACVEGELFEVDPTLLAELDEFEGCPDLYQRTPITLTDGTLCDAYTLSAERARNLRVIERGVWRREIGNSESEHD